MRRYQNPDGTLTLAGKARYGKTDGRNVYHDKRYQNALLNDIDTSKMPRNTKEDRKKKEAVEYEILKAAGADDWNKLSKREQDRYVMLDRMTRNKSGNYYFGAVSSKNFQKKSEELNKAYDNLKKIEDSYEVGKEEYEKAKKRLR